MLKGNPLYRHKRQNPLSPSRFLRNTFSRQDISDPCPAMPFALNPFSPAALRCGSAVWLYDAAPRSLEDAFTHKKRASSQEINIFSPLKRLLSSVRRHLRPPAPSVRFLHRPLGMLGLKAFGSFCGATKALPALLSPAGVMLRSDTD